MNIKFGNLPLNEVAVRFTLDPPLPDSIALFVDFLAKLGDSGVEVQSILNQAELPPGSVQLQTGPGSFSGARLLAEAGSKSIHLQPSLLAVRWHGTNSASYPGFGELKQSLLDYSGILEELLGKGAVSVRVVNMFYMNVLEMNDIKDLAHFLKSDFFSPLVDRAKLKKVEMEISEGDTDVRMELLRAEPRPGTFILTCAAGRILPVTDAEISHDFEVQAETLDRLHEYLCINFVNLLTDNAKKEWELNL